MATPVSRKIVGLDHPRGKVLEHLSLSFREWSHDPILRRDRERT
jgi:hypothetical protein